jgi:hypothetical protein
MVADNVSKIGEQVGREDPDRALDGVAPPPGYEDPTLVVWHQFGRWSDRLTTRGITLLVYLVIIGFLTLIEPRDRPPSTFAIVQDSIIVVVALLQGWLMSVPGEYYAAGESWMLSWTNVAFKRADLEARRSRATLNFDELRRVRLRTRRRMTSSQILVRVETVQDRAWEFDLTQLQSCPPLAGLLEAALDHPEVTVDDGVREALRRRPRRGAPRGRAVLRAGFPT